jgi:hypothetical protein
MSRTSRANARRRFSLLTSTSLAATSVLAAFGGLAVTALTPAAALAAACSFFAEGTTGPGSGPTVSGGPEVCKGSTPGIDFSEFNALGGLGVNLNGATVTTNGVSIEATDTGFINLLDIASGSTITNSNAKSDGILITGKGGLVSVDLSFATPVTSTVNDGVHLTDTGAGAISFNTAGNVQGARDGIYTLASTGATKISSSTNVAGGSLHGIASYSSGGPITVAAHNVSSAGSAAILINAHGGFGSVTTTGVITGGFGGIYARGTGVYVGTSGGTLNTTAGDGIFAESYGAGAATISSGDAITIAAGFDGIEALDTGVGTGKGAGVAQGIGITTTAAGAIGTSVTPVGGNGIFADITNAKNGDNVDITLGADLFSTQTGIFASTAGAGNINIVTQHGANIYSTKGDGVDARAYGGGNVYVVLLDGSINSNTSGAGPSAPSGPTGGSGATAGLDPNGAYMTAVGSGTVTILDNAPINNNGPGDGIRAYTVNGANTVTVNGAINNTLGNGVNAKTSGSGNITVVLGSYNGVPSSVTTTGGNGVIADQTYTGLFGNAVVNSTGGGSVHVTAAPGYAAGILARVHDYYGVAAVEMTGTGGSVTVEGSGPNNLGVAAVAADNGFGHAGSAYVLTNTGLTVTVGTLGGNDDVGVVADTRDAYNSHPARVQIGDANTITVGSAGAYGSVGVLARATSNAGYSGGPASVTGGANDVISVTGSSSAGVVAVSNGYNPASVTFGDGGAIRVADATKSANDVGVEAFSYGGSASVNLGTTSVSTDGGVGIAAFAGHGGAATVTSQGNINAGLDGIDATASGTGAVVVNYGTRAGVSPTLISGAVGIKATSTYGTGANSVTVNVGAPGAGVTTIRAAGTGIYATGGGTVGVFINGKDNVYGAYNGIYTNSGTTGTVYVASGATISNLGGTKGQPAVVDIVTGIGKGDVTVLFNNGTITSNSAAPANQSDLAIKATGGAIVVNNAGTIDGRVDFSGVAAGFASTINNAGKWYTIGTSVFGPGTNTINNTPSGDIASRDVTTFSGTIALNNNGTISLGNSLPGGFASSTGLSDADTDDVLFASGTTLNGLPGSTLALDADLSFTTQASCTALTGAADCLAIKASTGVTGIVVADTGAHPFGALNPGIAIVTGSSGAGTFVLDPRSSYYNAALYGGTIDKPGLFFYDLAYNAGTEYLISAPKQAAFTFAVIGGAMTDLWYTTTQTWFDRQADLRDTVDGKPEGTGPGVWLKAVGDSSRGEGGASFSIFNKTYNYNLNYSQDAAALIGGVDVLSVRGADTAFVLGLQGGYVDSNMRFNGPTTANITGSTWGVYGTYLAGGLFIDAIANGNWLNMTVASRPRVFFNVSDRVRNLGGQVEAGYAMPFGGGAFFEPLGLLAYEQSNFSNLQLPGAVEQINNVSSFRGALGGRIGANAAFPYYRVKVALTGRVWDEFDGAANTILSSPGAPNFLFGDSVKGVFGEVQGEANIFANHSGLSAFVNGGYKFKTRWREETVTLGARYTW